MSAATEPEVRAAGAVLCSRKPCEELIVAVIHRPRYDDWSLPKGKLDPGETAPVAAIREIHEETGFTAVLGRFLERVHYDVPARRDRPHSGRIGKSVDYFAAYAGTGRFRPNSEVDEVRWLPAQQAAAMLSYPHDAEVLERFLALPAEATTLMLVRHAKAGKREEWDGDDDLRPLSHAGVRQADALRTLLRAFGPDRVFAAPRLRCVQTVRGCAEDLGTEVAHEPLFSEEGYSRDPVLATARLVGIAAGGGAPLVCSQGAVIPHLVNTLTERDDVQLPGTGTGNGTPAGRQVASKKGSLWLLSFTHPDAATGPRLVAADYFPSPLPAPAAA